jgi:RNA polymerase sigma-70 factor, ECF subfamily
LRWAAHKDASSADSFPRLQTQRASTSADRRMLAPAQMTDEHELDPRSLGDHVDRLYRAAWGLCGSREDAEDLVQETFAKVLSKRRFVRSEDDLGYLLSVLRNVHISSHRTRMRRPQEVAMPEDISFIADPKAPTPERHIETAELYEAISTLPDDFRDAVVAVDLIGLSYREAAKALHTREATITTRVYRGRKRLAEQLG